MEADGTLLRGEAVVHLPPRELAALRFLAARAGQIVTPGELREALWGDVHVTADSVPRCVSSLRARLDPDECIQTVYKRGYRFSAELRRQEPALADGLPRLAVLPFENGFNIPEHLGPAIAEETITRLTARRRPVAKMLARDSVFTLYRRGLTAQQIGETLKADYVLAGILCALPAHYRLRAEMIRVEDGTQIWVEDCGAEGSRRRPGVGVGVAPFISHDRREMAASQPADSPARPAPALRFRAAPWSSDDRQWAGLRIHLCGGG